MNSPIIVQESEQGSEDGEWTSGNNLNNMLEEAFQTDSIEANEEA